MQGEEFRSTFCWTVTMEWPSLEIKKGVKVNSTYCIMFSFFLFYFILFFSDAHIDGCSSDGLIRVVENQSFHTYCGAFGPYREATFYWQIQPWRQNETLKVVCSSDAYLCPSPGVRVHVHVPEISSLTIDMVERAMFNSSTLTCNVTFRDRPDWSTNDSCLIEVTCKYILVQ